MYLHFARDKLVTFYFAQYWGKKYKSATQRLLNGSNSVWLKKIQLIFLPLVQYSCIATMRLLLCHLSHPVFLAGHFY
jgi:hypothetical protein